MDAIRMVCDVCHVPFHKILAVSQPSVVQYTAASFGWNSEKHSKRFDATIIWALVIILFFCFRD
jgi:hypothetical protein